MRLRWLMRVGVTEEKKEDRLVFKRDKVNLDIYWLKDESLEDSANLPPPDIIAAEIMEDLQAALEQFSEIAGDLGGEGAEVRKG
jgi:hypothetical protein